MRIEIETVISMDTDTKIAMEAHLEREMEMELEPELELGDANGDGHENEDGGKDTGVCEIHSFCASICSAIQQQKLVFSP